MRALWHRTMRLGVAGAFVLGVLGWEWLGLLIIGMLAILVRLERRA